MVRICVCVCVCVLCGKGKAWAADEDNARCALRGTGKDCAADGVLRELRLMLMTFKALGQLMLMVLAVWQLPRALGLVPAGVAWKEKIVGADAADARRRCA